MSGVGGDLSRGNLRPPFGQRHQGGNLGASGIGSSRLRAKVEGRDQWDAPGCGARCRGDRGAVRESAPAPQRLWVDGAGGAPRPCLAGCGMAGRGNADPCARSADLCPCRDGGDAAGRDLDARLPLAVGSGGGGGAGLALCGLRGRDAGRAGAAPLSARGALIGWAGWPVILGVRLWAWERHETTGQALPAVAGLIAWPGGR